MLLSEKMSEVYEAYDISMIRTMRGRGITIIVAREGLFYLQMPDISESRLQAEYLFKERLYEAGFERIDRCIKNTKESLVTFDRYNNPYVLRHYFEGRECNITDSREMCAAVKNLARFHSVGRAIWKEMGGDVHVRTTSDFRKRNQELRRIRTFVAKKHPKRSFESLYLSAYDYFCEQAYLCEQTYATQQEQGALSFDNHIGYCHGMYNHHSVLVEQTDSGDLQINTIGFDKFYVGNQLSDLYHFLRKAVEKNNYDKTVMQKILMTYDIYCPLSRQDLQYIFMLYSYPEKFYKISNQYMNAPKNWISPKLLEKLERVMLDEGKKLQLLKQLAWAIEGKK